MPGVGGCEMALRKALAYCEHSMNVGESLREGTASVQQEAISIMFSCEGLR